MSFNAVCENKILVKISGSRVSMQCIRKEKQAIPSLQRVLLSITIESSPTRLITQSEFSYIGTLLEGTKNW